ncbi:MAG: hypothetical protein EA350_12105 [Gemmatimonadales bacterium]|nr:MAG: hypothetical protein EA350_12105 [Gemmatimonadales bacterium]
MIHLLAFFLYLGAFLLWIRFLVSGARGDGPNLASGVVGLAVVAHAVALGSFWAEHGELPLAGPGAALSTLAFVGGLALLALLPVRQVSRVGVALLPFITVCQGIALLVGIQPSDQALAFQGAGFILHVTFAFLGYQGLALASSAGFLYLIQHHELKAKRMGRFFHFIPPLATLDLLGQIGVWVGFVALSLALGFGWAWTVQHPEVIALSDPKVLWAILSWVVFAAVLLLRRGRGRREYRSALASVVGFSLVLGSYLVVRLTSPGSGFLP